MFKKIFNFLKEKFSFYKERLLSFLKWVRWAFWEDCRIIKRKILRYIRNIKKAWAYLSWAIPAVIVWVVSRVARVIYIILKAVYTYFFLYDKTKTVWERFVIKRTKKFNVFCIFLRELWCCIIVEQRKVNKFYVKEIYWIFKIYVVYYYYMWIFIIWFFCMYTFFKVNKTYIFHSKTSWQDIYIYMGTNYEYNERWMLDFYKIRKPYLFLVFFDKIIHVIIFKWYIYFYWTFLLLIRLCIHPYFVDMQYKGWGSYENDYVAELFEEDELSIWMHYVRYVVYYLHTKNAFSFVYFDSCIFIDFEPNKFFWYKINSNFLNTSKLKKQFWKKYKFVYPREFKNYHKNIYKKYEDANNKKMLRYTYY